MNKKIKNLSIISLILILLISAPVSAGWLDMVFKSLTKKTEKQIVKQSEKETMQKSESYILKKEEKQLTKQEQILINKQIGNAVDDTFKKAWCSKNKCIEKLDDIPKKIAYGEKYYITNDFEAQKFINTYWDTSFSRRPDMLEIRNGVGKNRFYGITIYDVKTSTDAITSSTFRGQTDDYLALCNKLNLYAKSNSFCKVNYVLPKNEIEEFLKTKGGRTVSCLAIGLIMVPDPTDALCLLELKK